MSTRDLVHCAATLCFSPAEHAFAYLAEPRRLGEWALGCWSATEKSDGLVQGTSLFDGSQAFVRLDPDEGRLIVDFDVGDDPAVLVRRISARVVPGQEIGQAASTSLIVLSAWRTSSMSEERWQRLVAAHDAEVLLLRHGIEASLP